MVLAGGIVFPAAPDSYATPANPEPAAIDSAQAAPDTVEIAGVSVEGHAAFSTRRVLETVGVQSRTRTSRARVLDHVKDLLREYRDAGYPRARVIAVWEPADGQGSILHLQIEEGEPGRVGAVSLEGCGGVSCGALESLIETREGAVLSPDVYRGDLNAVLDAYENRGYPYAAVATFPEWGDSGGIDLTLVIDEGPRVVIDAVRIEGNASTREHVIRRECGIRPGETYVQKKIDRVRPRLLRLGFFSDVRTSLALEDESGASVLDIQVEERKTNSLYGAVGYVPREPKGYLTGILDLSFGNIGGTGRSAAVRWRTYRPGAFEWTFSYGEPWILGSPLEGKVRLHQEVRDSTFTQTVAEMGLEYPLGDRFRASLSGRTEGVTPGSGGAGVFRGSRTRAADLALEGDGRDDPLNPTGGWRGEVSAAYGRKQYDGDAGSILSARYGAEAEFFVPVAGRQVLAAGGSVRWLATSEKDVPEYEQFYVGGAESLRGYGEDEFYARRVLAGTLEYRYLTGRRSRLHVFIDGAWLDRRLPAAGGVEERKLGLLGYGFGLRS
ncbi:MAG: POTRA domain-containing protein, partial [Candidatus Eisenbacteria bacterium]